MFVQKPICKHFEFHLFVIPHTEMGSGTPGNGIVLLSSLKQCRAERASGVRNLRCTSGRSQTAQSAYQRPLFLRWSQVWAAGRVVYREAKELAGGKQLLQVIIVVVVTWLLLSGVGETYTKIGEF